MSSSCIEEVSVPDDNWSRIVSELLGRAGITINGSSPSDPQVKHPDFFKRVLREGSLGLGESYMDGWWECERLDTFFASVLRAGLENQLPRNLKDTLRVASSRLFNLQSKKRAWIVGKEHYDLGNDLFSRMLDPFMQYSCAYWKDASTLEEAQQAKLRLISEKLQLQPGMRVLDIGCGWGGLAYFMAKHYGVSVVGVTISAEQQKMARERCQGLDVDIRLQDYRDLNEQFDRIVSVGMFEHVGARHYDEFFAKCRELLKPEGVMLLHTIGKLGDPSLSPDPFTDKWIFPGYHLPALSEMLSSSQKVRLIASDIENLRLHYAYTLEHWLDRATRARDKIVTMYDERFFRMWEFYLAGGIVMFENGAACNYQVQYIRERTALPITRDYIAEAEARYRKIAAEPAPAARKPRSAGRRQSLEPA